MSRGLAVAAVTVAVAGVAVAVAVRTAPGPPGPETGPLARDAGSNEGRRRDALRPVLENLGRGVILPATVAFADATEALEHKSDAFADSPSRERLEALRGAWRSARVSWGHLEPCLLGPDDGELVAAKIDTFPIDIPGIERVIAADDPLEDDFVEALGARQKGMLAIEYLIFDEDGGMDEALAHLTSADGAARRRSFLVGLSRDVASIARVIVDAWRPEGGGFLRTFIDPPARGARFDSVGAAIDAVINRMVLAVERMKDERLRMPVGTLREPHPELVEANRSDHSIEDLLADLEGVRRLYEGTADHPGLGARVALASPELDESVRFALSRAEHNLRQIPPPLDRAVLESQETVSASTNILRTLRDRLAMHLVATYDSNLTFGGFDGD